MNWRRPRKGPRRGGENSHAVVYSPGLYFFLCMGWNVYFIPLILASTVIDYFLGILLETARPRWRKPLLIVSIVANLGFLGFFRSSTFFSSASAALLGL